MSASEVEEPTVAALIDQNGMFVEDVMVLDADLTEFHVRERSPGGFHWPRWNGTEWVEGRPELVIGSLISRRHGEVNAQRDALYVAGMVYNGDVFDIDMEAQKDMSVIRLALVTGLANAHGGAWRTADNQMVPMDDTVVIQFINTAMYYVQQIKAASWAHKDAISALTTAQDILAYDITTGWPS